MEETHSERTSATMATTEEVQEALQQLQAQGAHIAALETQLQIEQTRATTAEEERSALVQTLVTTLSKGSRKGKSKRYKGQNHMSNVKCWNCGRSRHFWRDCREMWWSGDTGGRAGDAHSRPLRDKSCRVVQEEHGQEAKERGRPTGVPAPEVDVEAQPGAAQAERKIGQRQCRVLLERRASRSERRFD